MNKSYIQSELDRMFDPNKEERFGPVYGPASEDAIELAEKSLGIKFPISYRLFLQRFGGGYCGYYEIFGLFDATDDARIGDVDVVTMTIGMSKSDFLGIDPSNLSFFCNEYNGRYIWMDMSGFNGVTAPVYTTSAYPEVKLIASDFLEFLQKIFDQKIDF